MLQRSSNSSIIFIGILFLVVGLGAPWYTELNYVNLLDYKTYLFSLSLLIGLPIYWLVNFKRDDAIFQLSKSQLLLLVFFTLSSASYFWSVDSSLFLGKWFLYVFGFIVFYVAIKIQHTHQNYVFIALAIALVSILVAGIGVLQYLYEIPTREILVYENIPASTFGNKNAANQFIVLAFPVIVYLLVSKVTKAQFLVGIFALVCTVFYVYYATTKSVWIAISVESLAIIIYWIISKKNLSSTLSALFKVVSFLLVISIFSSLDLMSSKSSFGSDSKVDSVLSTLSDRYISEKSPRKQIWHSAMTIADESPVYGHGLGSFPYQLSVEGIHFRLKKVHNDLLEMYVELGLVGLILFILFSWFFIKDWVLINKSCSKKDALFFNLLMVAFGGSFINMMVSWPYQSIHGVVVFSVFAALMISKANLHNHKTFTYNLSLMPRIFTSFLVMMVVVFSFFTIRVWVNSLSDFYYHSGMDGFKFNLSELDKHSASIPYRDIHLSKVADGYWKAGHHDRASRVYLIVTKFNSSNMLGLYRQFITLVDQSSVDEAEKIAAIMVENNKMHPLTFRALLNLYRAKKDIKSAKNTYQFYKQYFNRLDGVDKRAYKTLHHWSIILGLYDDTEYFYKIYTDNFVLSANVESNMANYYVYTQQYEKSVKHMNYALEHNKDLIKPKILKVLIDKGLVAE